MIADKKELYDAMLSRIDDIIRMAEIFGYVVTVEQVPLKPLAMGNYYTKISLREKLDRSEK